MITKNFIKPIDIQITIIILLLSLFTSHSIIPILFGLWVTVRLYEEIYKTKKVYWLFYIYTIFEFLIKIRYSFTSLIMLPSYYFNILEHIIYTIIITILFFYILKPLSKNKLLILIANIGLINSLSIINEIIEYLTRSGTYGQFDYYTDTIKDLTVNLITTAIITCMIIICNEHRKKQIYRG